ncbi:MAG: HAD family phosphatase [Lachnospiraceae bacterium]|nr:HAD family phosphatase [Lachnospiraceae bacterium]
MLKAVVFDMDGVLYDTESMSVRVWKELQKELDLPGDMDEIHKSCVGVNLNDGHVILKRWFGEDFDCDGFFAKARAHMLRLQEEEGLSLMKGVREILDYLKEHRIPTAICSSTQVPTILEHLRDTDMEQYFDRIIGGNMVEHSKPKPDIYLKACEALGLSPEECIGVEDSPNGIRSCSAAGLFTVMVPDLIEPTEEILGLCDLVQEDLLELLEFVKTNVSV